MICYWAINRTDPQNSLSMTLDVPLQEKQCNVLSIEVKDIDGENVLKKERSE